jgi:hypothetical protein
MSVDRDQDPNRPPVEPGDPRGGTAYPGGGMLPPTGDMDDPIPEAGMPGEPPAEPDPIEDLERDPDARRDIP